jgi:SRSO17 transposase
MEVHASPATLPELDEFVAAFQVRVRRPQGAAAWERCLTGLLTERPHQHGDTMAAAVPGTSAQRLQELLTPMPWDAKDLHRQRVEPRLAAATIGTGALVWDATGVAKPGQASVGVARQYAGRLGQGGTCQVAVPCCSSAPQASWPVAVRLSLPWAGTQDPAGLQRARGPPDVTWQTTPPLARARLEPARAWGVPHRWWPMRPTGPPPLLGGLGESARTVRGGGAGGL